MTLSLTAKSGIQPELRRHFVTLGSVAVPIAEPLNAVEAERDIDGGVIALLNDGDTATVTYPGMTPEVFTFDAASVVADGQFRDADELAALIDGVDGYEAAEVGGDVEMEATVPGAFGNNLGVVVTYLADTTAGGGPADTGDAQITAADIAELEEGDTVVFAGETFTRAAATSVVDREFVNTAGLADCIDDLADWDAAEVMGDVDISSTLDGAEWNGYDVVINYDRTLGAGENGTPAVAGAVCIGADRLYISRLTAGPENQSWEQTLDLTFTSV